MLILVISYASANYLGLCISEMRYLSDEEKIDATVFKLILRLPNHSLPSLPMPKRQKYNQEYRQRLLEEFYQLAPDCCRVTREDEQGFDVNIWGRLLTGSLSDFVRIEFDPKVFQLNYSGQNLTIINYIPVTNCGKAWNDY